MCVCAGGLGVFTILGGHLAEPASCTGGGIDAVRMPAGNTEAKARSAPRALTARRCVSPVGELAAGVVALAERCRARIAVCMFCARRSPRPTVQPPGAPRTDMVS